MIRLHTITGYADALYSFLMNLECLDKVNGDLKPYYDSKKLVTIGIGFNVEGNPLALNIVLKAFGIDPSRTGLSAEAIAAENEYLSKINAEITKNYADDLTLQQALNAIMAQRAADSRLSALPSSAKRTEFNFADGNEIRAAYDQLIPHYEQIVTDWMDANGITFALPELQFPDTEERQALVSLAWNNLIGPGKSPLLAKALLNEDRAEAFYEIAYNSNAGESRSQGIANRRYREADYKAAYRMFTRHKTEILGADGALGGGDGYEDRNPPPEAGMSIFWQLKAARDFLLPLYDQGVSIAWSNILVGEDTATSYYRGTDNDALTGSNNNDLIFGYSGHDVLYGSNLSEYLIQELGNGILVAGGGNDILLAGAGNDLLDGGSGDDTLMGEAGNDTYIFRRGSGQDTITDSDPTPNNTDTIWLGSNLIPADVTLRRAGNNLVLSITNTPDTLTVNGYFTNDSPFNRIERIQFQDGTTWTDSDILRGTFLPTSGDDVLYGGSGDDTLTGAGGNDTLYGQAGDDALEGGPGNDIYIYNRGDGSDTITDYDVTPGNTDTIRFAPRHPARDGSPAR